MKSEQLYIFVTIEDCILHQIKGLLLILNAPPYSKWLAVYFQCCEPLPLPLSLKYISIKFEIQNIGG